jgi:thiol-disulfide isomerase/thioredoxin
MRWFGATVLVCLIACFSPSVLGATQAVSPVPPFELVTFEGESYSNESLKGRPALLVFWAPWCKVCQKDLPVMGEFYQRERPAQLASIPLFRQDMVFPADYPRKPTLLGFKLCCLRLMESSLWAEACCRITPPPYDIWLTRCELYNSLLAVPGFCNHLDIFMV